MRSCASMFGLALGVLVGTPLGFVACGGALFPCAADQECQDSGVGGVCQPEGVCSFPDDECPSGQKFGSHSGGLSNECVPEMEGTTGTSTGAPGTSSADDDPTLDVSGIDTRPDTSSDGGPVDATGEESTSSTGTTGTATDPTLLLWFTFEHDSAEALENDGALGGTAPCLMGQCPLPIDDGVLGRAASFDGVDDCGIFPFVEDLNAPEFTLALWVRRDLHVAGYDGAFTKPVGEGAYNTWRVSLQATTMGEDFVNVHVGLQDDSGVELERALVLGVWTHFAATWSGSALEMFIDGESVGMLPSPLFEVDTHDVYVGCDDDVPIGITHFLSGALDDVRMYSRVLEAGEIAELATSGM